MAEYDHPSLDLINKQWDSLPRNQDEEPDTLQHIMSPAFTTKEGQIKTGLLPALETYMTKYESDQREKIKAARAAQLEAEAAGENDDWLGKFSDAVEKKVVWLEHKLTQELAQVLDMGGTGEEAAGEGSAAQDTGI
eukprot:TRINITY_DN610_c0_g1_i2.p1 TRINITY_DN610_c0_g1~~TRINITY_DN610_c0_g1_i2.p1  ORF type:complete len:136 (+),score=26.48 TRINITY_DN610_c0_g1_i2:542-949(+)